MNESDKGAVSDDKKQVKTVRKIYPQIYSFILPNRHQNDGWQKVGYTEQYNVDDRIEQEVKTAALKEHYEKLWSASSVYPDGRDFFKDKKLHAFYRQNGIQQSKRQDDGGLGQEWFYFGNEQSRSKQLFDAFKNGEHITSNNDSVVEYTLRAEQEQAVSQTLAYAEHNQTIDFAHPNEDADYLWNAKPRFGKTLASYDFAKRFNAKQVLIITNRPSIANSWYDDCKKFIDCYYFISTTDSLKDRPTLSREEFINRANPTSEDKQITFLSLQDLKGGKRFGGKFNKLDWVADLEWDLLIFDEAHEASDTDKTLDALDKIKRRFSLYLSGTPFKALANNRFHRDQIFNWTYLDEQKAKRVELANGGENGPHTNLPDMRLFTYKMSDIINHRLDEGIDLGEENYDFAFDLNEMFAVKNGRFIHEKEIQIFLDQLTSNKKYPFSTPELRDELKHTFWLVGNRVAAAKAMARLLRKHPIFGQYHVVIAAGDGKIDSDFDSQDDSDEEIDNIVENENAFNRVKAAIKKYDKTITLSVGQLTTGVTVKEWSAVLMLSDIKSESLYMQAIFRSQNPYDFSIPKADGSTDFYRKKSAYVFDFSPSRVLQVYDKFANGLQAEVATGQTTELERQNYVAELLNYFPVLAEDKQGEMVELDAEQVLTYPKAIMAREVVNRGFVTNYFLPILITFLISRLKLLAHSTKLKPPTILAARHPNKMLSTTLIVPKSASAVSPSTKSACLVKKFTAPRCSISSMTPTKNHSTVKVISRVSLLKNSTPNSTSQSPSIKRVMAFQNPK
ncbi:MAG: DEAD/DEAH box helicase [Candidatus Nanosyncoccaceae bacterium]